MNCNAYRPIVQVVSVILVIIFSVFPAAHAANLLAGWTFNASGASALTADLGALSGSVTLSAVDAGGSGNTLAYNGDGTISLGAGKLLYTNAINSTTYSSLLTGVTIWVEFKQDSTFSNNSALWGLAVPSLSGGITGVSSFIGEVAFGYANSNGTVRSLGTLSDGTTTYGPGSGFNTVTLSTWNSAAIVFSDSGSSITYFDTTNGTTVTRTTSTSLNMDSFSSFYIGRLMTAISSGAITLDEVRIYDGVLSAAEISALTPVAIPEPERVTLLFVGLGILSLVYYKRCRSWRVDLN